MTKSHNKNAAIYILDRAKKKKTVKPFYFSNKQSANKPISDLLLPLNKPGTQYFILK